MSVTFKKVFFHEYKLLKKYIMLCFEDDHKRETEKAEDITEKRL